MQSSDERKQKYLQVPLNASSLNSNDVFILFSPTVVYIWCGKGCTGDEREMAKKVSADGKADSQIMAEGSSQYLLFFNMIAL
jgi:hypothetical protein